MWLYRACSQRGKQYQIALHHAYWFITYIAGLTFFSWLGEFGGGRGVLPLGWDCVVLALFSFVIFHVALRSSLPKEEIKAAIYDDEEYRERFSLNTVNKE